MLINPYRDRPQPYPGTRYLEMDLGAVGVSLYDERNARRVWTITHFFSPLATRAAGGVRARLIDQKGFVTFCNQKDLEVLLGRAAPGDFCQWSGDDYAGPEERERWFGLCCDDDDLLDDLLLREWGFRNQSGGVLCPPLDIYRYVHLESGYDYYEHLVLIGDGDPETGIFPDYRLETVNRRWIRSERERVVWERT